jgi:ATP-dependent Clp protease ATP-binding subunit ClpA/post-segregation antitoxin (ccd killing protein)
MPKINVYLPDDLAEAVKEAGVPVSAVCQRALEQTVRRVTAIREAAAPGAALDDEAPVFEQFTGRAHTVVRLAHDQALADSSTVIGTEHLLGGLLAEGANLALHVLRVLEIEPDRVWSEIARRAPAVPAAGDKAAQPFTGPAMQALELAVTEAAALGQNFVGSEHLLLGLVAEPDGTAGQILRGMGADHRLTRRAVAAALAGYYLSKTPDAITLAITDPAKPLSIAIRHELEPVMDRLAILEERVGLTASSPAEPG